MRCLALSCLVLFFLVWSILFQSRLVLSSLVSSSLSTCPTCVIHRKIRCETHVPLFSGIVWSGRILSCLVSRGRLFSGLTWSPSAPSEAYILGKTGLVWSSLVRSGQDLVQRGLQGERGKQVGDPPGEGTTRPIRMSRGSKRPEAKRPRRIVRK